MIDSIRIARLSKLHTVAKPLVEAVLAELEDLGRAGSWQPLLVSTLRPPPEQLALWKQGRALRTIGRGWQQVGPIVTRAMPWQSAHCFGVAADIALVDDTTQHWLGDHDPAWDVLGKIVEKYGLEWGGRWKFRDCAHMQLKDWQDVIGIQRIERMRELMSADLEIRR